MAYHIKRTLLGKIEVHWDCPQCGEALVFPISDAGTMQPCPDCGAMGLVPGVEERRKAAEAAEAAQAKARRESVDGQRQRERERLKAIEQRADRELKHNQELQQKAEREQESIHERGWADVVTWPVFRFLRFGFAIQIVFGWGTLAAGAIAVVCSIIWLLIQATKSAPQYDDARALLMAGLVLISLGYGLVVTAGLGALFVHIERNTRALLDR